MHKESFFKELAPEQRKRIIELLKESVTPQRWEQMERNVAQRTRHLTMVLEDVYQSHNAGAVLRSCEAMGLQDIHFIEKRNQIALNKTTVHRGASKWMNASSHTDTAQCLQHLKSKGYQIVATALLEDTVTLDAVPVDRPTAVVIGNEMTGVSNETLELADYTVKVPMVGFVQSYNLSVTAALVVSQLLARIKQSDLNWPLNPDEQDEVTCLWLSRCVNHWEEVLERAGINTHTDTD